MISKNQVIEALGNLPADLNILLLDVTVSSRNKIIVTIDGPDGITIDHCARITRQVESVLNRDVEDYELEVSSAGVGQPLRIKEQYPLNIGRKLQIFTTESKDFTGILRSVSEQGISIEIMRESKGQGKKNTEPVLTEIPWEIIKTAKVQVSLK